MEIIDTHLHVFERDRPDRPRQEPPHPWAPDPHPIEDMLPLMDQSGVAVGIQVTPMMMGYNNLYSIEVVRRFPDRLAVLARFDPMSPHPRKRLQSLMRLRGVVGIRLTLFRPPEDEVLIGRRLDEFWTAATELGVVVGIYAPARLRDLLDMLERHPSCHLIIDHMGLAVHPAAPDPFAGLQYLPELAAFGNVRVKISGVCELSSEPYPFRDIHGYLAHALEWFGADRIMWGSDYPNTLKKCAYEESLSYVIDECGFLTKSQLEWILAGTARQFLQLNANPSGRTTP